jgi:hypothetical protein
MKVARAPAWTKGTRLRDEFAALLLRVVAGARSGIA